MTFVPKSSFPTSAILALGLLKKKEEKEKDDKQFCMGGDNITSMSYFRHFWNTLGQITAFFFTCEAEFNYVIMTLIILQSNWKRQNLGDIVKGVNT